MTSLVTQRARLPGLQRHVLVRAGVGEVCDDACGLTPFRSAGSSTGANIAWSWMICWILWRICVRTRGFCSFTCSEKSPSTSGYVLYTYVPPVTASWSMRVAALPGGAAAGVEHAAELLVRVFLVEGGALHHR